MLTRCAKDYSSSRSQIVLVYLQPSRRISLLKCPLQPKIAKINKSKPHILGVQGLSKSSYVDTTKKLVTSACCDK